MQRNEQNNNVLTFTRKSSVDAVQKTEIHDKAVSNQHSILEKQKPANKAQFSHGSKTKRSETENQCYLHCFKKPKSRIMT